MAALMKELDEILRMQQVAALGLVRDPTEFCDNLELGEEKPVFCACANSLLSASTQEICNVTETQWKCVNQQCQAGAAGEYSSYPDCNARCSAPGPPGPPSPPGDLKYNCVPANKTCIPATGGAFNKLEDCKTFCSLF